VKSEEFKFVFTRFDAKNFRDNTNFNVSSIKKGKRIYQIADAMLFERLISDKSDKSVSLILYLYKITEKSVEMKNSSN
jgi:hypothetical protein